MSCRLKETQIFEGKVFLKLASTFRVKIINSEYLNSGNPINRPYFNIWPLMEFETIGDEGSSVKTYCLIYRIPTAKGLGGEIKLINSSCDGKNSSSKISLSEIKDLKVWLVPNSIDTKDSEGKIMAFTLTLIFQKGKEKNRMEFPLLNLSKDDFHGRDNYQIRKTSISTSRFSNGVDTTYVPGIIFLPFSGVNKNGIKVEMIGEISDNYPSGTSKLCHSVDEKCQTKSLFVCERCKFGWFEVVPTKCPLTGDKFCGVDRCGERGYPACFRGFKYAPSIPFLGCDPSTKAAFCQNGLRLICDTKGVLVCD